MNNIYQSAKIHELIYVIWNSYANGGLSQYPTKVTVEHEVVGCRVPSKPTWQRQIGR